MTSAACVRQRTESKPRAVHRDSLKYNSEENTMGLGMILLIVLILMLVGAVPTWPHSRTWGYAPSGGLGLVLIIIIVLLLTGRM